MRGQAWSFDFIVSLVIFVSVITVILFSWSYSSNQAFDAVQNSRMQIKALRIADNLIRSPGVPENWNENNVVFVGLMQSDGIISESKLATLLNTSYDKVKSTFELPAGEFYISLKDSHGNILPVTVGGSQVPAEYGLYPGSSGSNNSTLSIPARRFMLYNGNLSVFELILWKN